MAYCYCFCSCNSSILFAVSKKVQAAAICIKDTHQFAFSIPLFYFVISLKPTTMKKVIIGGLVGGILLFAWQTVSWTVSGLHEKGQAYTAKQDTIINFLNGIGLEEGSYLMPREKSDASSEEMEKAMKEMEGKPWAKLTYYKAWSLNMGMNMARGLIADIIIICLLCWIFGKMGAQSFSTYLIASLCIGIIAFTYGPYTGHIWYPLHDISGHFIDALASWGLVGIWLGWWMSRK
jgi:hypothetical protein